MIRPTLSPKKQDKLPARGKDKALWLKHDDETRVEEEV